MDFSHLRVPAHLHAVLERAITALPPAWLQPPATGEIFQSKEECKKRLQGFALNQGFAVVAGKSYKEGTPRNEFLCIHHGDKTRNDRGLEEKVEKDSEGKIISQRQREATFVKQKSCKWRYICSYRPVKRGDTTKVYYLTVTYNEHSHELGNNPFAYKIHETALAEYQQLIKNARKHRMAMISYSTNQRVLEQEGLGLTISSKTYYNLVRTKLPDKDDAGETIQGLLIALEDAGFLFRIRVAVEEDLEGNPISRKLIQIFFIHREQIRYGQRFIAGFLLVVDGTFNTNALRLPLLIAVGITNSGKTFPLAFSYCPSESAESYKFFFDCLNEEVFTDGVLLPGVVLGDEAGGLIAAMNDAKTAKPMTGVVLQHCNWHAVEAMKKHFRNNGYKKDAIDDLSDLSWAYIKSATVKELETSRHALLNALQPSDRDYIANIRYSKEYRVIYAYTKRYPNLGAMATQRGESYHPVMREITNGQLSLEESANRLCKKVLSILKQLSMDEDKARVDVQRTLDAVAFRNLIGNVSLYALKKLQIEWTALAEALKAPNTDLGPCKCELLIQFSLPCKHHLLQAYQTGQPVPKSLLHPRWWLNGPPNRFADWQPTYPEEQALIISPKRRDIMESILEVLKARDTLGLEEKARLDKQILRTNTTLLAAAESHRQLAQLPLDGPDPIPKKQWLRKKKEHDKADIRALTGAEIAERNQKAKERGVKAAKAITWEDDEGLVVIPDSPTVRLNYLREPLEGESQGGTTITVTPRRAPSTAPAASEEKATEEEGCKEVYGAPPSTAPPQLESSGRVKRPRAHTVDYRALAGLPGEGTSSGVKRRGYRDTE